MITTKRQYRAHAARTALEEQRRRCAYAATVRAALSADPQPACPCCGAALPGWGAQRCPRCRVGLWAGAVEFASRQWTASRRWARVDDWEDSVYAQVRTNHERSGR